VLLHYLNEIEEAYPPLLIYQHDSPKKLFNSLIITNPTIGVSSALKMLGLKMLLNEVGVREFRQMTKQYGYSTWYSLNKEMKKLNKPAEVDTFSVLRQELNKFEPLHLLAFQDQMLNNDKYN